MAWFQQKEQIEDYLQQDPLINPHHKYALVSFISPEKILVSKDKFKMSRFLHHIFTDQSRPVQDIRAKLSSGNVQEFSYEKVNELYEDFLFSRDEVLEEEFHKRNDYQCTVRGLKIRAICANEVEVKHVAKKIQQTDKIHSIYCCELGAWCPWDPSENAIKDSEYQLEQLNSLAKEYETNQSNKNELFEQVKREKLEKARKELNERKMKLAEEAQQPVKTTTAEEDVKNISELRSIIDESDKKFYDGVKKEAETASASMGVMTSEDPWIARKKEQEQQSEESA